MSVPVSLVTSLTLAGAILAGTAAAQTSPLAPPPPPSYAQDLGYDQPQVENVNYGYAQVLRVNPVYEDVRWMEPEQRCEGEPYQRVENRSGVAGAAIGALLGAVAGRQVGDGHGRDAATIGGAVAGGVIGRNIERAQTDVTYDSGCRTVNVEHSERRITAYDVEYSYKGDVYGSRLGYDPGQRLRVRTTVAPAEDDGVTSY
ncbi:glycine zipper 2TM domain-containing protein [Coralloluteibacterium stylophorae]|uniref:Glycine zipper 2TM domain-containing protein n=2 Tax=Coralloluteibacterium stylophorae TaxID=1776034 RepID=A0AAP2C6W7_9GAMM|nr:glycine zipper 2TM domain-containing protein [Coralloluteibacterium stylophorae]MBS7455678.1 glycine zipper 2TM domain-containing protein [Coralloluteibacterium stylophorae]